MFYEVIELDRQPESLTINFKETDAHILLTYKFRRKEFSYTCTITQNLVRKTAAYYR